MKLHICFLLVVVMSLSSCENDDDDYVACQAEDQRLIVASWGNAMFISNSDSCIVDSCISMNLVLDVNLGYELNYTIFDSSSGVIGQEINDKGTYIFECEDSGFGGGRYSYAKYLKGTLIMSSDSLPQRLFEINWTGVYGLELESTDLGLIDRKTLLLERI